MQPSRIELLFVLLLMIAMAIGVALFLANSRKNELLHPGIPQVLPQDPAKVRPAPELPTLPDVNAPVNKEIKLVPPRKGLPPAPPVPDMNKILKAPVNKDMKLLPARKDLPPAPPLPPVQFPETNQ